MQRRRRVVPLVRPTVASSGGIMALGDALGRMTLAPLQVAPSRAVTTSVVASLASKRAMSQSEALVDAIQRPRGANDSGDYRGRGDGDGDAVTALLSPSTNAAYCPVVSIKSARGAVLMTLPWMPAPNARDGTADENRVADDRDIPPQGVVYGRVLGAGTNARVYALERPASASIMEGLEALDVPLAIKIPVGALAVAGTGDDVQAFMQSLPCWDGQRHEYACPIEVETEALLSALASGLFTDGITPGTVVQARAFACPGAASERPLCIVQERLGRAAGGPDGGHVSSVERLPLFLDLVEGRPAGGLAGRVRRIESAAVEICVSVLHTLAVMQSAFKLNVLDVRPANLLLKVLEPGARYFRQQDTSAATGFALLWPRETDDPHDVSDRGFVLPNRGWLVKVADMGMAAAYGVARLEPIAAAGSGGSSGGRRRPTVATTVAVTTERSSEQEASALKVRADAARATYARSRARALASGLLPQEAAAMAARSLSADEVRAINTFAERLDERRAFGIEPRFVPGYDAHTLVASMAEACMAWIGRVPAPIAMLRDTLAYSVPSGGIRPALGAVSPHGPRAALDALYAAARASKGPAGAYMASYLADGQHPSSPSSPGIVVIQVPTGPVLLSATR